MKHSKLLAAGATCLLAIAAFATKAHRHTVVTGFYSKGSGCNAAASQTGFTINSRINSNAQTVQTNNSSGTFTVYSVARAGACAGNKLYVTGLPL